ncbi:hypothetical protein BXK51_22565 [Salmonella enterica subsp. enterica serovar Enteritidis]|nr:hypothetical protein [Salmonella enterica subsp. enterica serovar Enteritidis]EDL4299629.1 hypothetical protein [Salmonella enterica subsp. enterica serovar Infantis]EDU7010433.1 hypothetical protein [Salmonella enterica subsp. enterica serovar Mbandaka]EEC7562102.1 hypothetical protein [Escherichia coli]EDD8011477.1 hypothetical protein [Salmonella enterica subsp. enterica serovar Enteritidis]
MKYATILLLIILTAITLKLINHVLSKRQCRKIYKKAVKEGMGEEFLSIVRNYDNRANGIRSTEMDVIYRIALSDALCSKMKQASNEYKKAP